MAKFNATDFKGYIVTSAGPPAVESLITETTSCEISVDTDEIDVTTKDSRGWGAFLAGLKTGTATCNGFQDFGEPNGATNFDQLWAAQVAGAPLTWRFKSSTQAAGTAIITWSGFINNLTKNDEMESGAAYSFTVRFTGEPTYTNVSA